MAHKKPEYRIVKDFSFHINGYHLPVGSIYGNYTGYTHPIKWIIPKYPQTVYDNYDIFILSGNKWIKAVYSKYKKLCLYLDNLILSLELLGKNTIYALNGKIHFQTSAPYGRPHKMTGLKEANKNHLSRGDNTNLKWDSKHDGFTDRRYTKNIVY